MQTLLTIKTDKVLKESAQEIAKELGVPLSTAVNAFLRQFVRDRELTVSASYQPSTYLRQVIAESEKELEAGKTFGPFASVDKMMQSLDA